MIRKGIPADIPALIGVWETAVVQTHDFLSAEHFQQIKGQMPGYLRAVELIVWEDQGSITGFAGISGDALDMLFVSDRGRGIGKILLEHLIAEYGVQRLEVNEQNTRAIEFYKAMGFEVTGRSATDSGGRPYPLLHMSLKKQQ